MFFKSINTIKLSFLLLFFRLSRNIVPGRLYKLYDIVFSLLNIRLNNIAIEVNGVFLNIDTNNFHERGVLCFGSFEKGTTKFIERYVTKLNNGILIDVGANIGLHTLTMRSSLPSGSSARVISIEPNPDMLFRLNKNISLNNFNDVIVIGKGASSQRGVAELKLSYNKKETDYHNPGLATSYNDINCKQIINIELSKVDDMLDELEFLHQDVQLVKIDIEGAEFDSLQGMKKILSEGKPAIILEYNVTNFMDCNTFLESYGYTVFGTLIRYGINSNLRSENILFLKKPENNKYSNNR